jgi:hypothetical protein
MPTKSGREAMPANGSLGSPVLLVPVVVKHCRGSRELGAGRKSHHADLVGVDLPVAGVGPHHADGLLGVVHFVGLRIVSVAAQTAPQDDGVHSEIGEERHEVRALAAHVEGIVAAPRDEDHRRAGIQAALDAMHFDGRIVNVDDAVNAPGHRAAHTVLLGYVDLVFLQIGRIGRKQWNHDAALQNGLRGVRGVGLRPRLGHTRWERGSGAAARAG